jgi:hypothetical protein
MNNKSRLTEVSIGANNTGLGQPPSQPPPLPRATRLVRGQTLGFCTRHGQRLPPFQVGLHLGLLAVTRDGKVREVNGGAPRIRGVA